MYGLRTVTVDPWRSHAAPARPRRESIFSAREACPVRTSKHLVAVLRNASKEAASTTAIAPAVMPMDYECSLRSAVSRSLVTDSCREDLRPTRSCRVDVTARDVRVGELPGQCTN